MKGYDQNIHGPDARQGKGPIDRTRPEDGGMQMLAGMILVVVVVVVFAIGLAGAWHLIARLAERAAG